MGLRPQHQTERIIMLYIDGDTARNALKETERYTYTGEASSLGLPDNVWPATLHIADIGNGLPLFRMDYIIEDVDVLIAVDYRQHCGVITVRIFND
jgi:hypothetical protein